MRSQDALPRDLIIVQEAVGRDRLRPARARRRDTRRRSSRPRVQQRDRSLVQSSVPQINFLQFLRSPAQPATFSKNRQLTARSLSCV